MNINSKTSEYDKSQTDRFVKSIETAGINHRKPTNRNVQQAKHVE